MEADDTAELEVNDELIGMISGTFGNTSNVEERQDSRELLAHVENLEEEEITELPEHRFVMKEEKTTLFIGDYIFRRRYVRGDLATFTCTGCEKISRKTRGGNKGKKDASAVAQKTDEALCGIQRRQSRISHPTAASVKYSRYSATHTNSKETSLRKWTETHRDPMDQKNKLIFGFYTLFAFI